MYHYLTSVYHLWLVSDFLASQGAIFLFLFSPLLRYSMSPTLLDSRLVPIRRGDRVTNSSSSLSPTPERLTSVIHAPSGQPLLTSVPTSSRSSFNGAGSSSSSVASHNSSFSSGAASSSTAPASSSFSTASSSSSSAIFSAISLSSISQSVTMFITSFSLSSSSEPSSLPSPSVSPTTNTGNPISITTPVTSQSFLAEAPPSSESATSPSTASAVASLSPSLSSPTPTISTSGSASGALAASSSGRWHICGGRNRSFDNRCRALVWRRRRAPFLRNSNYSEKYLVSQPVHRSPSVISGASSQNLFRGPTDVFANPDIANYPPYDPFAPAAAQRTLYAGNASLPEITYSYAQDVNNQYPYYGDEPRVPSSGMNSSLPTAGLRNPFEPVAVPARNPFEPVYTPHNSVEPGASTAHAMSQTSSEFDTHFERISDAYTPSLDDSFYGFTNAGVTKSEYVLEL
ncbi:hypothetical protein D9757_002630 [Collybiopsis confluens]|uniref:Uncharacterized protein n=1 Tax=Collybiopsis confluens TaxID=2823264 RepID=A0A8H5HWU6_9AGAR|nr:hypothetical protein D9757_002630 [Collybiopsis confluens]